MLNRYNVAVKDFELYDHDLVKIIETRFKVFTDKFKIERGVVYEYKRHKGEIMYDWVEHKDQSDETYQKVRSVYDTIDNLKKFILNGEML